MTRGQFVDVNHTSVEYDFRVRHAAETAFTSMRIDFTKMHGLGNDFIVFDAPRERLLSAAELRQLADRHTGIGFDQALMLEPPRRAGTNVYYRIFNADGIEVEQCGNGARCVAAWLQRRHPTAASETVRMDSPAGEVRARILAPHCVSVEMGIPSFEPRAVAFETSGDAPLHRLEVNGVEVELAVVSIGNPHAVLTVDDVDTAPVASLGPAIEGHRRFAHRVNVGFMQILDRGHIRLRVYERGVGETLACGTGACAAVAVGRRRKALDAEVRVSVRGGELRVNWSAPGSSIWLTGPAHFAFEGHLDLSDTH